MGTFVAKDLFTLGAPLTPLLPRLTVEFALCFQLGNDFLMICAAVEAVFLPRPCPLVGFLQACR